VGFCEGVKPAGIHQDVLTGCTLATACMFPNSVRATSLRLPSSATSRCAHHADIGFEMGILKWVWDIMGTGCFGMGSRIKRITFGPVARRFSRQNKNITETKSWRCRYLEISVGKLGEKLITSNYTICCCSFPNLDNIGEKTSN
jgi:hypothetical protein